MHDFSCSYLYISTYQTKLNQSILKKYDLRDYIKLLFLITHPKSSRSRASRPSAGTVAQHWAPNFPREEVVCSPLLFVRCSISLSNIIISKILGMSTIIRLLRTIVVLRVDHSCHQDCLLQHGLAFLPLCILRDPIAHKNFLQ